MGISQTVVAFKNLYEKGIISIAAVRQAVLDGVITEEEYKYITNEDYLEQ